MQDLLCKVFHSSLNLHAEAGSWELSLSFSINKGAASFSETTPLDLPMVIFNQGQLAPANRSVILLYGVYIQVHFRPQRIDHGADVAAQSKGKSLVLAEISEITEDSPAPGPDFFNLVDLQGYG